MFLVKDRKSDKILAVSDTKEDAEKVLEESSQFFSAITLNRVNLVIEDVGENTFVVTDGPRSLIKDIATNHTKS